MFLSRRLDLSLLSMIFSEILYLTLFDETMQKLGIDYDFKITQYGRKILKIMSWYYDQMTQITLFSEPNTYLISVLILRIISTPTV